MDSSQCKAMFVTLPQKLAASHLQQCERQLNDTQENCIGLLYSAQSAHMALHTILITVGYAEVGLKTMRREEKTPLLEEGVQTKSFKCLVERIQIGDDEKSAIILLNDVRDRLQHPIPGPAAYSICDLVLAIEAATKVGRKMWDHPCIQASLDEAARDEAVAASDAVVALCSKLRSQCGC